MGDFIQFLNSGLNLSPLNTILLAVLGFFIRWAVKELFSRLNKVEQRNRRQDLALARIEERLGMLPMPDEEGT